MYMIRPFPGRVNPTGEKEYAGFYCWFAHANQQHTRHYSGGKISFQGQDKNKLLGGSAFFNEGGKPLIERLIVREPHPADTPNGRSAAHEPIVLSMPSKSSPAREYRRVA